MTENERQDYQLWRATKSDLKAATLEFAAAVGRREPEGCLVTMAHGVAELQGEERRRYAALRKKMPWRRLTGATTWPTPLASAYGDV